MGRLLPAMNMQTALLSQAQNSPSWRLRRGWQEREQMRISWTQAAWGERSQTTRTSSEVPGRPDTGCPGSCSTAGQHPRSLGDSDPSPVSLEMARALTRHCLGSVTP